MITLLSEDPDPREVNFVVDVDGKNGKSWLCKYLMTNYTAEDE